MITSLCSPPRCPTVGHTHNTQGLAIPKHERDPKITGLLDALLIKLEATKAAANLAGQDADKVYLEEFALKVFSRADRVDRAGLADKKTAVTFLAAFYFFEVLRGDVLGDVLVYDSLCACMHLHSIGHDTQCQKQHQHTTNTTHRF